MLTFAAILLSFCDLSGEEIALLASGRLVTVHSDAWSISTDFTEDTASIRTAGRNIVVDATEVRVDDDLRVFIDGAAKSVIVEVNGDKITLIADGRTLAECPR